MPTKVPAVSTVSALVASPGFLSDSEDVKPPRREDYSITKQVRFAPNTYHIGSPHIHKPRGKVNDNDREVFIASLVPAHLPSQSRAAVATGCVNKPTAPDTTTSTVLTLNRLKQLLPKIDNQPKQLHSTMEEHDFDEDNGTEDVRNFPVHLPMDAQGKLS